MWNEKATNNPEDFRKTNQRIFCNSICSQCIYEYVTIKLSNGLHRAAM